jgi:hypothetical protein
MSTMGQKRTSENVGRDVSCQKQIMSVALRGALYKRETLSRRQLQEQQDVAA